MNNVSVKGVVDETGVKNFMITNKDSGEVHVAMRDGQKFILGEFRGTLAQCKQLVSDGEVVHFADRCTKIAPDSEVDDRPRMWDHVDPCALLILMSHSGVDFPEVKRTLDAHGWLLPDGSVDVKAASENFEQWKIKQ
jgi:hypothetical protein